MHPHECLKRDETRGQGLRRRGTERARSRAAAAAAQGLRGRTLFVFANGPIDPQALAMLSPTDLRLIRSEDNVGLGGA